MKRLGRSTGAALLLGLALVVGASGQAGEVSRTKLPNGLVVLVRENPTAPVVAVSLMVKMGTRWETRDTAGISNFLQLMVVRGTTSRSGPQIVEIADGLGGSIDAYGEADYSEIAATALARYWVEILELVADVALNPSIPDGVVGPVRDFLVRQVRNRGERPFTAGLDALTARLFGSNPYAWDPVGLRESLERMDREALLAQYRRHYVPAGMVLAVSGQVKAAEVLAQVQRLFGQMPAGTPPVPQPPPPPPAVASRDVLTVPGAQAQILIGTLAPALSDPDYPAVKVLSTVLGGGMAGRFFSELRDQQGLAYTTAAQYPSRVDTSYFSGLTGNGPRQRGQGRGRPRRTARSRPAPGCFRRGAAGGQGLPARPAGHGSPYQRPSGMVPGRVRAGGGGPRVPGPLHRAGECGDRRRCSTRGPAVSRCTTHSGGPAPTVTPRVSPRGLGQDDLSAPAELEVVGAGRGLTRADQSPRVTAVEDHGRSDAAAR